jgi:hypothetical protein
MTICQCTGQKKCDKPTLFQVTTLGTAVAVFFYSLFPTIFGVIGIKATIALSVFGGSMFLLDKPFEVINSSVSKLTNFFSVQDKTISDAGEAEDSGIENLRPFQISKKVTADYEESNLVEIQSAKIMHDEKGDRLFVALASGSEIHLCSGAGLKYIIVGNGSDTITFLNNSGAIYNFDTSVVEGFDLQEDKIEIGFQKEECRMVYNLQQDFTMVQCLDRFAVALLGSYENILDHIDYYSNDV